MDMIGEHYSMPENQMKFNAPALSYLTDGNIRKIHLSSIKILEHTGSRILHPGVLDLLKNKGVKVRSDGRAYIPESLVEWAVAKAPSKIIIHDRYQKPAMSLEKNNVYFGTGSDCQYFLDPDTGEPKDFTFDQMQKALRIADNLPHIDFVMGMGLAPELDAATAFQKKYWAMLKNCAKPQVLISGPDIRVLEDMVEMGAVVAGSRELLRQYPSFLLLVDPTSPLVHSREAVEKLVFMAKNRLPVIYAPGIMAGATSPVTMAGAIAQANAEILAGLVIHQLTNPGAPFVYGGGMSPMDMKSSQPTYSAPEAMMAQAGLCQMSRDFYHLPTWGFGGCSASKLCDAQAVNEATTYNLTAAWAGTNLVHDVGYIEFGITYSLELLVLSNEFIGQARRMMGGIVVDDEHLALDAIDRVGPGGSFLTDPHTFSHFKKNWQPDLTDRRTRKNWKRVGSLSMEEGARERITSILDTHIPDPMDDHTEKKLNRIIQRAETR